MMLSYVFDYFALTFFNLFYHFGLITSIYFDAVFLLWYIMKYKYAKKEVFWKKYVQPRADPQIHRHFLFGRDIWNCMFHKKKTN